MLQRPLSTWRMERVWPCTTSPRGEAALGGHGIGHRLDRLHGRCSTVRLASGRRSSRPILIKPGEKLKYRAEPVPARCRCDELSRPPRVGPGPREANQVRRDRNGDPWDADPVSIGRRLRQVCVVAAPVVVVAIGLTSCSSTSNGSASAGSTATVAPLTGVASPTDLPPSCRAIPVLGPVSPTPTWPSGFQILNAVPSALSSQYPTVFGGEVAAPATPGESAVEVNSHLVVLETVRDPELEAEVKAAYPRDITITFALSPRSQACLNDLNASVASQWKAAARSGITVLSSGIGRTRVDVGVSACTADTERAARQWFSRRWGDAVSVQTCQKPAVNASLVGSVG